MAPQNKKQQQDTQQKAAPATKVTWSQKTHLVNAPLKTAGIEKGHPYYNFATGPGRTKTLQALGDCSEYDAFIEEMKAREGIDPTKIEELRTQLQNSKVTRAARSALHSRLVTKVLEDEAVEPAYSPEGLDQLLLALAFHEHKFRIPASALTKAQKKADDEETNQSDMEAGTPGKKQVGGANAKNYNVGEVVIHKSVQQTGGAPDFSFETTALEGGQHRVKVLPKSFMSFALSLTGLDKAGLEKIIQETGAPSLPALLLSTVGTQAVRLVLDAIQPWLNDHVNPPISLAPFDDTAIDGWAEYVGLNRANHNVQPDGTFKKNVHAGVVSEGKQHLHPLPSAVPGLFTSDAGKEPLKEITKFIWTSLATPPDSVRLLDEWAALFQEAYPRVGRERYEKLMGMAANTIGKNLPEKYADPTQAKDTQTNDFVDAMSGAIQILGQLWSKNGDVCLLGLGATVSEDVQGNMFEYEGRLSRIKGSLEKYDLSREVTGQMAAIFNYFLVAFEAAILSSTDDKVSEVLPRIRTVDGYYPATYLSTTALYMGHERNLLRRYIVTCAACGAIIREQGGKKNRYDLAHFKADFLFQCLVFERVYLDEKIDFNCGKRKKRELETAGRTSKAAAYATPNAPADDPYETIYENADRTNRFSYCADAKSVATTLAATSSRIRARSGADNNNSSSGKKGLGASQAGGDDEGGAAVERLPIGSVADTLNQNAEFAKFRIGSIFKNAPLENCLFHGHGGGRPHKTTDCRAWKTLKAADIAALKNAFPPAKGFNYPA